MQIVSKQNKRGERVHLAELKELGEAFLADLTFSFKPAESISTFGGCHASIHTEKASFILAGSFRFWRKSKVKREVS